MPPNKIFEVAVVLIVSDAAPCLERLALAVLSRIYACGKRYPIARGILQDISREL